MPVVTSVALTDSATITYTGMNFFTSEYTAHASFNSIWADSVTISDDKIVVAKWNKGVPAVSIETVPVLKFTKTGGRRLLAASNDSPLSHYATN